MKNSIIIIALLFVFNSFSQNLVASNTEVSTSNHSTEVIAPKVTKIDKLFYDPNESELSDESIASLNTFVLILNENPKMHISINSYTDIDENEAMLSANRALKVKHFLLKNGITSDRLKTNNFGNSKPTYEGYLNKLDRRVEFIIE